MAVDELQGTGNLEDTTFYGRFWDTHLKQVGQRVEISLAWSSKGLKLLNDNSSLGLSMVAVLVLLLVIHFVKTKQNKRFSENPTITMFTCTA